MMHKVIAEKEFIVACSVCLKVKINDKEWVKHHEDISDLLNWEHFKENEASYREIRKEENEKYFSNHQVSHGLCPECYKKQMDEINERYKGKE